MKKTKIASGVLSLLVAVLIAVSAVSGLYYVIARTIADNFLTSYGFADNYVDGQFVSEMKSHAERQVKYTATIYAFNYDAVKGVVSDDGIERAVRQYLVDYYDAVVNAKSEMPQVKVDFEEEFKTAIDAYMLTGADDVDEIYKDEETRSLLAKMLTEDVERGLSSLSKKMVFTNLVKVGKYIEVVEKYTSYAGVSGIVCLVTAIGAVVMALLKKSKKIIYNLLSVAMCTQLIYIVPLCMLRLFDFPGRVVIGEGVLKSYTVGLWNMLVVKTSDRLLIPFVITTLVYLATVVMMVVKPKAKGKKVVTND